MYWSKSKITPPMTYAEKRCFTVLSIKWRNLSDSIHLHQSVSFPPSAQCNKCPASQLVSFIFLMLDATISNLFTVIPYTHHQAHPMHYPYSMLETHSVTSGDMLPCHNPLPTMCHTGLPMSSSLGKSIIISHITVLGGLLNGLYITCNTRL
jgi:hypothetical protein